MESPCRSGPNSGGRGLKIPGYRQFYHCQSHTGWRVLKVCIVVLNVVQHCSAEGDADVEEDEGGGSRLG